MTTKTTGAEFKRFYNDPKCWPQDKGDTWHEDEVVLSNGEPIEEYDDIPDNAIVSVDGGIVFGPQWDGNEPSFETFFKRWRKQQDTVTIVVDAPKDKADAIKAAIKAAGGRVTS